MNDRPRGGERVVLVHIDFPAGRMEEDLEEFKELSLSAGAEIASIVTGTRRVPEAKFFVGSGKVDEIRVVVAATKAQLVIFNHELTPAQERNLEKHIQARVLDRTGLILDIFAQRALSFEGKLQVELAMLRHLSTRLIRGWTHLERQRGGIGLRGPGETQLEVDRRLIRNKIKLITSRLAKIQKQREQGRRSRRKATIPTIALVGYTNAGKSTLFNRLTGASVYVANKLFATLDPTLRRMEIDSGEVILADTVGFIRHLPHELVKAFHATLEEVSQADLLFHVIDAHDENRLAHIEQVDEVLKIIGAQHVPKVLVYNKIDLNSDPEPRLERDEYGFPKRIYISAHQGIGIDNLIVAIKEYLYKEIIECELILANHQAKLRSNLYTRSAVVSEQIDDEGNFHLIIRLPRVELEKLFR